MMEEQNIKEAISLFVKITSHTFILFLNRRTLQRLFGTATLLASLLLCFIKSNKDAMNTSTPNRKQQILLTSETACTRKSGFHSN